VDTRRVKRSKSRDLQFTRSLPLPTASPLPSDYLADIQLERRGIVKIQHKAGLQVAPMGQNLHSEAIGFEGCEGFSFK
jgi:hypothetical protein